MKKVWIIGISILLLIVIGVFYTGFGLSNSNVTSSAVASGVMKISLSEISEKAKWYGYDYGGTKIKFFVVKADDGSIKTGFDACDVCYKSRKGYRQEGGYMVCNNCGNRYPISGLGTKNKNPGGCWPGYLPSSVDGDNLIIKKSDLIRGRNRFI